jgi:hypothetical protein
MVIVLMVTLWFGLVIEQLQSELTINPEEGQVLREGKRVPLGTIGFEVCVWYEKCMSGVQKKKKKRTVLQIIFCWENTIGILSFSSKQKILVVVRSNLTFE